MMEEGVAFRKVDNVKPNSAVELSRVLDAEIEPLKVTVTVGVVAHEAVKRRSVSQHANLVQVG